MDYFIYLSTTHGKLIYILTYAAAAIFLLTSAIISGKKARYPMSQWLLILFTGLLFFVIGNKVFTYSIADLSRIFEFSAPENTAGKTVMGGIIGMFCGIGIARFILGFRFSVLDRVAVSFPIAMAIHRIGCLFSGCCHGVPTELPWGIRYGPDSHAYHAHILSGSILPGESGSIAVHPNQLYQIIGCLIIAFIVWQITRNKKKINGIFLVSLILYLWLRFFTEFFRDPLANGSFGAFYYGLKLSQWAVLGGILLATMLLLLKFKNRTIKVSGLPRMMIPGILRETILTLMLLMAFYLLSNWFDLMEISVLSLFLVPVAIVIVIRLYRSLTVPGLRMLPALLLVLFITLSAQQLVRTPSTRIAFTDLEGGLTYGYFEHMYEEYSKIGSDCYEVYSRYNTRHRFIVTGASIGYNEYHGMYRKFRFGSSLSLGLEFENKEDGTKQTHILAAVNPNFTIDFRWLGLGAGLMLGNIRYEGFQYLPEDGNNEMRTDIVNYNFYTRLGPYDYFYVTLKRCFLNPTLMMKPQYQLGVGTGLGRVDGRNVEGGIIMNNDDDYGGYLLVKAPFKKSYEAGLYLGIDLDESSRKKVWQYQFALNLRYKFKFRELRKKAKE